MSAIVDVYGGRPADAPLAIGSVKTNFGHLESAAGICGLIKALLLLEHREIPPHLHLEQLNPHIRIDGHPVVIPTKPTAWFGQAPRLAAVSAFGFVGTNAHVILEGWDEPAIPKGEGDRGSHVLTLSAPSEQALDDLRERFVEYLEASPDADLGDVCHTSNTGRSLQQHRIAVVADNAEGMRSALQASPVRHRGIVPSDRSPQLAFLFTGQGSQQAGVGRRLYQTEPVFRMAIDRCEALLQPHLGLGITSLLFAAPGSKEAELLNETRYAQPGLLSLEYALFEQWRSWGVEPSLLLGHSVGEYVAACAAGILSLEDAIQVIAARGRLMQALPSGGAMAAVFASEAWAMEAIADHLETLALAAVNAPNEVVLSGAREDLLQVLDRARAEGLHARELIVSHAFHSPLMRPMLANFRQVLEGVAFHRPTKPLISNATGALVTSDEMSSASYWLDHVLAPVRFQSSVETLRDQRNLILLEIGPAPVLVPLALRSLGEEAAAGLPSLRPDRDDVEQMLDSLAALYVKGARIDWAAFDRPFTRRKLALPTYPFQRERFWMKPSSSPMTTRPAPTPTRLLGERLPQAPHQPETFVWEADLDPTRRSYLFEHKLLGNTVWPISAQIELALAAARDALGLERCRITSLEFRQTLYSLGPDAQKVQTVVTQTGPGQAELRIYSRLEGKPWVLNTQARLQAESEDSDSFATVSETSRASVQELQPDDVPALVSSTADALTHAKRLSTQDSALGTEVGLEFSMMFFAAKEDNSSEDRYRLIMEAAHYADLMGFRSVWVPERHFTHMGSLYPNPSVLHAALARETKRVRLMAGSVVLPLHNPVRVAEEWAMVDNLSGGRVGMSLASGWNPDDFVLAPGKYDDRYNNLYGGIELLRRLWRGEPFEANGVPGRNRKLRIYPTPVQPELPLWITAARSPESFKKAGALGANLLTHLLDQDVDTLAEKIALYRGERAANGHDPDGGNVTVMCHSFLAADGDTVHRLAKKPFCEYLKASKPLMTGLAYSRGKDVDIDQLSEAELDDFAGFLYDRFGATRALLGTPERCLELTNALQTAGVNEVACLLDFGPTTDEVLQHLPYLNRLREAHQAQAPSPSSERTIDRPVQVVRPRTTLEELRARCNDVLSTEQFYADLSAGGVEFNGGLRSIASLALGQNEALAEVRLAPGQAREAGAYVIHPVLLDACLQTALAALPQKHDSDASILVPVGVRRTRVYRPVSAGPVWSHAQRSDMTSDGNVEGDITAYSADGEVLFELEGLKVKSIRRPAQVDEHASWFYEIAWRNVPWPDARHDARPRPWLILEDESGVALEWAASHNHSSHVFVRAGAATQQVAPDRWIVNPDGPAGFARVLREIDLSGFEGIACLWPLDAASNGDLDVARLEADQRLGIESVTALVQALAQVELRHAPRLWLVTCGAQPVGPEAEPVEVSQSTLWGFAGALAREHPGWWGGIVDLAPASPVEQLAEDLDRTLRASLNEDQIGVRGGQRYVRRVVRASAATAHAVSLRNDSAYLIVGGLGGLGLGVARWMAGKGARHLILMGRSPIPPASPATAAIEAMRDEGIAVTYAEVDVSNEKRLTSFLTQYAAEGGPPVRGVVHAAGVFHDESLLRLDKAQLWEALRAKLLGAWALHRLLPELDFFVLFSSFSAITPPRGQANYAAACTFLDSLAHFRRGLGRPALSINWGAWSEVGFAATPVGREAHAQLEAMGMRRMTPSEGLAVLERLMSGPVSPQVAVFPMDVRQMAMADPALEHAPLLEELTSGGAVESVAELLHQRMLKMDVGEQRVYLVEQVARTVSAVMEIAASRLDVDTPLTQLGLDSLIAVNLKNRLQKEVGLNIPLITVLRGASVSSMVDDLMLDLRVNALRPAEELRPVEVGAQQEIQL